MPPGPKRAEPALVLPFQCRDGNGEVRVDYGITDDPAGAGFGLIATGFEQERFRGFPAVLATVSFSRHGYLAMFGWVQVITRTDTATGHADTAVDLPPILADLDCPLYTFGYRPEFLGAPVNPAHPDGRWRAETFLVAVPDLVRSRRLVAVTGFRWGYDLVAGRPAPLPAEPIGPERWEQHWPRLRAKYPTWTFAT
jgi:hypothetical protein